MIGKPVRAGIRITVEHILRALAAGTPIDHRPEMYQHITRGADLAAFDYATAW